MMTNLADLVVRHAEQNPAADAVVYNGNSWSYEALADAIRETASGLVEVGLGRGERVGIYIEKRFETVAAMLGAAAAGCVFVPLNPLLKAR